MDNQRGDALTYAEIPANLVVEPRIPRRAPLGDESLEFHAARLLLLLKYAGGRDTKIAGRTKLAKLDFFVRYPSYLLKAAKLLGVPTELNPEIRAESPMIRYKYGPWDSKFYNVFAFLVAKQLIDVFATESGDLFQLTARGKEAVDELQGLEFQELIERVRLVNRLFGGKTGNWIKNFIYENFPEIVAKPLGKEIER